MENFGKGRVHFNLARMKAGGESFEVVIHPDKAVEFKMGRADIRDALVYDRIFADAKKGLSASEHVMKSVFGTTDPQDVAGRVIREGEIQLTSEFREGKRLEKRKAIVNIIHRTAIDPRSGFPHPPARIESALQEQKIRIDENRKAEDQVQEIVRKLMPVLPIKFEVRKIEFHIPAAHASRAFPVLRGYGSLIKDSWEPDGSLLAVVEIPAGLQQDLYSELNRLAHGEVESKIIGKVE